MSLQDILQAISAEADQRIADAKAAHQKEMQDLRAASAARIAERTDRIQNQRQQKADQMLAKAQTHARILERNASLNAKQTLLDSLYDDVTRKLAQASAADVEAFLRERLDQLPENGTVHPAKPHAALLAKLAGNRTLGEPVDSVGGFLFVSDTREEDCTFEHLVRTSLRPRTEVDAAHRLFS